MKRIIAVLLIVFPIIAFGQTNIPKPVGFIDDFEKVFTKAERHKLDSIVKGIEKQSTVEIFVVTLSAETINNRNFDSLTLQIAKSWKIGKKGKDNGILIAISKSAHKIRIQNGYGIEKVLSDSQTKQIIDETIIPQFKQGNYYEGVRKGIMALYEKVK